MGTLPTHQEVARNEVQRLFFSRKKTAFGQSRNVTWKRGWILNSKREMIGSIGLEQNDLKSEHK